MSYALVLPPDTSRQIETYLKTVEAGGPRAAVCNGILDQLNIIRKNPKLGAPVYGGPFESRRLLRFVVDLSTEKHDLQFLYKINEADRCVIVSGMMPTPE